MTVRLLLVAWLAVLWPLASGHAQESLRSAIDSEIRQIWEREKIAPPPAADDATFLRRAYLDLTGLVPTGDEAKAFLDDASPDKRAQLIDRLLASPRYGVHQADLWDMVYFGRRPPGYDS